MNRRLTDQFQLRLPDGMRDALKSAAEANDRSLNAEIVERLDQSFDAWPKISLPNYIKEKASRLGGDYIEFYEAKLNQMALNLAKEHFYGGGLEAIEMAEVFQRLIVDMPPENKRKSRQRFQDFIAGVLDDMPEEDSEEASEALKSVRSLLLHDQAD